MNGTSIYGELNMDPESNRIQWAFKGLREHVVIMNSPPNAYPDQEIYIEIPRGSEGDVMIPQIPQVTFDLNIESSKDKARTVVNNVSRSLIVKKELLLGGKTIEVVNISNEYDTYKDLYMTSNERQDALLQGIQSETGLKARLGATKVGDTALTLSTEETAIKKTLGNKFYIPLDFGIFKQPVYPFGLKDSLKVKLVFNSSETVILAAGDKDTKYTISNICLEFDKITDGDYAAKMMYSYNSIIGYSYPYDRVTCEHYELLNKKESSWKIDVNAVNTKSLRGLLLLFIDKTNHRKPFACANEKFYNPTIEKVLMTNNGNPHALYKGGILSRDLYQEAKKYFYKENSDVSWGAYCTTKFGFWVDFRSSTSNILHGSGRPTNKIMLIIDKVSEAAAGDLMCYVFTVEDSVLRIYLEDNIQKSALE